MLPSGRANAAYIRELLEWLWSPYMEWTLAQWLTRGRRRRLLTHESPGAILAAGRQQSTL